MSVEEWGSRLRGFLHLHCGCEAHGAAATLVGLPRDLGAVGQDGLFGFAKNGHQSSLGLFLFGFSKAFAFGCVGGDERKPDVRPHERFDQAIHHLQEKTTSSWSHGYQSNTAVIDPAKASRWTVRTNQNLTIDLGKPPAVPANQQLPDAVRTREWDVELIIFHANIVNIDWPAGVIWPLGTDPMTGDPVTGTPPPNPRPQNRADRFLLRYNERTGEWWALTSHAGVEMEDPINPDELATLPLPEDEDPETALNEEGGDAEPPTPLPGVGYALHEDGLSTTEDSGATWTYQEKPWAGGVESGPKADMFSVCKRDGTTLFGLRDGSVREMREDGTVRILNLAEEEVVEFPLENPDFETGNTDGWVVADGTSVSVLQTNTPAQRPGSTYYLTRDANLAPVDSQFQISQIFSVPESADGRNVRVSVDAFAGAGATGRLRVTQIEGSLDSFTPSSSVIPRTETFNLNQSSDDVNLLLFQGPNAGFIDQIQCEVDIEVNRSSEVNREAITFTVRSGGENWSGGFTINRPYPDSGGAEAAVAQFENLSWSEGRFKKDLQITLNRSGSDPILLTVPQGWRPPAGRRNSVTNTVRALSDSGFSRSSASVSMTPTSVDFETQTSEEGRWQTLNLLVPGDPGKQYLVSLLGEGSPADVYFDNVSAGVRFTRNETVRAIAAGKFRHIVVTDESVWSVSNGTQTRLAQTQAQGASHVSVEGDVVAYSQGNVVFVSRDNGVSFDFDTLGASVSQILVKNGVVYVVLPASAATMPRIVSVDSGTEHSVGEIGFDLGLTFDERRLRFVLSQNNGQFYTSENEDFSEATLVNSTGAGSFSLNVVAWDNGRWLSYSPSGVVHAYTDQPDFPFKFHFPFDRPLLDVVEYK